jgi:transposase-like protein
MLTDYGFSDGHWIKLHTNNPLEHTIREIRRRLETKSAKDI